jgi:large-conductance mechanosensitive channel
VKKRLKQKQYGKMMLKVLDFIFLRIGVYLVVLFTPKLAEVYKEA